MHDSYYLKNAHEVLGEIRNNPRSAEVLIAAKMERVVRSMMEKTQGRAVRSTPRIRCAVLGNPHEVVPAIMALQRDNYQPVEVWTSRATSTTEVFFDPDVDPLPVKNEINSLLPVYPVSQDPQELRALGEKYATKAMFGNAVIDSTVVRAPESYAQPGCFVGPYTCLGHFVHLGLLVNIGSHVSIDDEVVVGDYSVVRPGAIIGRGVKIGSGCLIGAGSIIGPGMVIQDNTTIPPGFRWDAP